MLYLHIRKRLRESSNADDASDKKNLSSLEEGVVKNNPLLGLGKHFTASDICFVDSASSDTDAADANKNEDKHHVNEKHKQLALLILTNFVYSVK